MTPRSSTKEAMFIFLCPLDLEEGFEKMDVRTPSGLNRVLRDEMIANLQSLGLTIDPERVHAQTEELP